MKKLKLSRTKKIDSTQQKISNFFTLAKQDTCTSTANKTSSNNESCKRNLQLTSKTANFQDKRLPGGTICVTCLCKLNSSSCNNCNSSNSISKETSISSDSIETIDNGYKKASSDANKGNNDESTDITNEDVIPPTPELHKKRKRTDYYKSHKKIVCALNTVPEISKISKQNEVAHKEGIYCDIVHGEKSSKVIFSEKENVQTSRGMCNPFSKSANKQPTLNQENAPNEQAEHCVQNQECLLRDTDNTVSKISTQNVLAHKKGICSDIVPGEEKVILSEKENVQTSRGMCNPFSMSANKQPTLNQENAPNEQAEHCVQNQECLLRDTDNTVSKISTQNVLAHKKDICSDIVPGEEKVILSEKENDQTSRGMCNPFSMSANKQPTLNQENAPNEQAEHCVQNQECLLRDIGSTEKITQTVPLVNGFHKQVCNNINISQDNPVDSFQDINDSFLDGWNFDEDSSNQAAVLENGIRCEVISARFLADSEEMLLTLRPYSASDKTAAICVLRESWAGSSVSVGDTVSVSAAPMPDQPGCWLVDDSVGLLTVHPDTLVSGTSVVGSLFCMRRSVLSDSYRGMDSDSSIMVIGSFLHELLQEVLKKKVSSIQEIKQVLDEFISSSHFIYSLYSSGMSLNKTKETLSEFIPKIHAFVRKYFGSRTLSVGNIWNDNESWDGKITDVADIEENIWAPRLGVKGKVDVTVNTVSRNKKKVMPLELKTGRASFSAEHRGQVILYTMMMSELGQTVDSGLLLYLREGVMREVNVGPVERRDLTLLRNQLVTRLRESQRVVMEGSTAAVPRLPPPINHHSACAKCPYLTLCSAALRVGDKDGLSEGNPLQGLSVASTDHLTLEHIQYVFHWSGLLRLEHSEALLHGTPLHNIWTVPPEQRKQQGNCLVGLSLTGPVTEVTSGSYEHVFELAVGDGWEGVGTRPAEGNYYIVSCDKRPAVAAGPVRQVLTNCITLHLERDLHAHYGKDVQWHLDKYESQAGLVFNMTNLGCLLDDTDQAGRLRSAVVDLRLPTFQPKLKSNVMKVSLDLVERLNSQQRQAVYRAIAADHFMLIKGMPGTGKTATMVALVELAVRLGLSVLVTSHTHSAVDNVLLRLRGRCALLRLGASHKLHPQLAEYGEHTGQFKTPDDIQAFYDSKNVVGVTCLGAAHPLLSRRRFDLCLVDEATQVPQPTVLRPIMAANKFILVGDPEQLPPMVRSSQAKKLGLGQSLFARLDRPAVTSELSVQYRMNERITQLANTLTYGGRLQCANPDVAKATLKLPRPLVDVPVWLSRALADTLDHSVVVLDTGTRQEPVNNENHYEAGIVIDIVSAMNKAGVPAERTGVIAPYRAQVDLLKKGVREIDSRVEVNTVDQYQGRDKDSIIYSCTRSSSATGTDILSDKNRLTVAITRSRHKLVIVGNVALLRGYPLFDTLFRSLSDDCIIPIS